MRSPRPCASTSPIRRRPGRRTSTPSTGARTLLSERRFDAIRFRGPGTDLTIGLLPGSRWTSGTETTRSGVRCVVNMPTEEIFTTPDRRRAEGVVRASLPLLCEGVLVEGLEMEFRGGRIVRVDADAGADIVRGQVARDEGSHQLGEVALVSGESGVYKSGLLFKDTLYDENAACHIAYGAAYVASVEGMADLTPPERYEAGLSVSAVHTDFMIGGARGGGRRAGRGRHRDAAPARQRLADLGHESNPSPTRSSARSQRPRRPALRSARASSRRVSVIPA